MRAEYCAHPSYFDLNTLIMGGNALAHTNYTYYFERGTNCPQSNTILAIPVGSRNLLAHHLPLGRETKPHVH
jgi:hypothetical protein